MGRLLRYLRRPRVLVPLAAVVVLLVSFGLYWFQPWKLWVNSTVNEALPVAVSPAAAGIGPTPRSAIISATPIQPATAMAPTAEISAGTGLVESTVSGPPVASRPASATASAAVAEPTGPVDGSAALPPRQPAGPVNLSTGKLISHEHETSGSVRVVQLADSSRVLTLENLATSNGPDVHVWLAKAAVVAGEAGWYVFDDDDHIDLGSLKGNLGNQVYKIPADVDPAGYPSVTIWCERFSVSFGAAQLIAS